MRWCLPECLGCGKELAGEGLYWEEGVTSWGPVTSVGGHLEGARLVYDMW